MFLFDEVGLTVCVDLHVGGHFGRLSTSVDSAWEQKKLEATLREMIENAAEPHTSDARFVSLLFV